MNNVFVRMDQQEFVRKLSYEVLVRLPEYSRLSVKPQNTEEEKITAFIVSLPSGPEVAFCAENLYLAYLENESIEPVTHTILEIVHEYTQEAER